MYNSNYNSPLINFQDNDFTFKYVEYQPVEFNEARIQGSDGLAANITAVMAYYAYLIVGMDYESFSHKSGEPYFKKMFNIEENVVYPMHGVGKIIEIATKTILNKKKKYYVVELINTKMRVMVPVDNAETIGLRHIMDKKQIPKIAKLLQEEYVEQEEDWKIRYQNNLTKVKSGSIIAVAEVCRNLYKRARDKELSVMERKLYESAYSLMINEVALAKGITAEDASNMISDILSK